MGGLAGSSLERGLEAAVRRDRVAVAATLVVLVALAWVYLWRDAATMSAMDAMEGMEGMSAMSMGASPWRDAALMFVMWSVMMVGMMLPSAAPAILLYTAMVRRNRERGSVLPAAWTFAAGYLAVWTGFSGAATALQLALERAALLAPMAAASRPLAAGLLIVAGIYQWLPLKEACLRHCRNPMEFMLTNWRGGAAGPFRMGAGHGLYCLGCCWALMLLLFVAGVMNLLWVALIAVYVLLEKLVPGGRWMSRVAGAAMMLAGGWLALS
jgi:predicted metal-binding membrane protein